MSTPFPKSPQFLVVDASDIIMNHIHSAFKSGYQARAACLLRFGL